MVLSFIENYNLKIDGAIASVFGQWIKKRSNVQRESFGVNYEVQRTK